MNASAFASDTLDVLFNASARFSTGILQQRAAILSEQTPTAFAEKAISYAKTKIAYYAAL
jgi:hypothetical protein